MHLVGSSCTICRICDIIASVVRFLIYILCLLRKKVLHEFTLIAIFLHILFDFSHKSASYAWRPRWSVFYNRQIGFEVCGDTGKNRTKQHQYWYVYVRCYGQLALSVNTRNLSQYQYHAKMDAQIEACLHAMSTGMTSRLSAVLEATLAKIARFDEGR